MPLEDKSLPKHNIPFRSEYQSPGVYSIITQQLISRQIVLRYGPENSGLIRALYIIGEPKTFQRVPSR